MLSPYVYWPPALPRLIASRGPFGRDCLIRCFGPSGPFPPQCGRGARRLRRLALPLVPHLVLGTTALSLHPFNPSHSTSSPTTINHWAEPVGSGAAGRISISTSARPHNEHEHLGPDAKTRTTRPYFQRAKPHCQLYGLLAPLPKRR